MQFDNSFFVSFTLYKLFTHTKQSFCNLEMEKKNTINIVTAIGVKFVHFE